jgi:hypothetical protein
MREFLAQTKYGAARCPDSVIRPIIEWFTIARNGDGTPQSAVKQTKADWQPADSLTGLVILR